MRQKDTNKLVRQGNKVSLNEGIGIRIATSYVEEGRGMLKEGRRLEGRRSLLSYVQRMVLLVRQNIHLHL